MLSRRIFPLVLLSLLAVSLSHAASEPPPRPNILFIVADDLGYEMLGCYGAVGTETPHLDQLAAEGMRFDRAYGSPVCTPTRVSLYTGLYPTAHGHTGVLPVHLGTKKTVDFSEKFGTYGQQLQKTDYLTSVTGKWQLATLEYHPNHIRDAGYDSWCIWQIWRDGAKTTRFWEPCFNEDGLVRDDIADRFGPDVLADYVIEQMEEATAAGKPFMIHHNMLLPHWPIIKTPDEKASGEAASVHHMITYMDKIVGRLVDAIDEMGIADNTCVIFLGDNGTDLKGQSRKTDHGVVTGGKTTLDHGGTHLPLLVRWPGTVAAGSVADDLIDVVDFYPTFCELADIGVRDDKPMDGISFAGRLLRDEPSPRDIVVAGYQGRYSVFDGKWRVSTKGPVLDSTALPTETPVAEADLDEEAIQLREELKRLLKKKS